MKRPMSWQEKLANDNGLPRVTEMTGNMSTRWGTGTVVIPAPGEVDEIMKQVTRGKLITINLIRETLAGKHCASIGCPITTGIFAQVAAHVAEETAGEGKEDITPYWRTLKAGGELNPKHPGGVAAQSARLMEEGHAVEPGRGKKPPRVKDFERALVGV